MIRNIAIKNPIIDIVNDISSKWQLSNLRTLVPLSLTNNYVAVAYSAIYKTDVVLKVLLANTHEPEALMLLNGDICVKLLDYDPATKCMLLEYITPGTTLKPFFPEEDYKAIEIAADVIKNLHEKNLIPQAKRDDFKTVNQWLDLLYTFKSKKIPEWLLEKAKLLATKLLSMPQELYLLHGDLHHENIILKSTNSWIVIDPKGVIGPLEYEVGRFLMNPMPDLLKQPNAKEIIRNRINKFSEIFGFEKQRLIDWAFAQAILSVCWAEQGENEKSFNYFMKFAETVDDL